MPPRPATPVMRWPAKTSPALRSPTTSCCTSSWGTGRHGPCSREHARARRGAVLGPSYTARAVRGLSAIRVAAWGVVAVGAAVPLVRRRLRLPPPVVTATAAAPPRRAAPAPAAPPPPRRGRAAPAPPPAGRRGVHAADVGVHRDLRD